MSATNSINDRIRKFVFNQFPLAKRKSIADDYSLLDGGIIDSLGVLEVVHFIENEFMITIYDEELLPENFQSIQSISDFIGQKLGNLDGTL